MVDWTHMIDMFTEIVFIYELFDLTMVISIYVILLCLCNGAGNIYIYIYDPTNHQVNAK